MPGNPRDAALSAPLFAASVNPRKPAGLTRKGKKD
jgi:hypothetical protein